MEFLLVAGGFAVGYARVRAYLNRRKAERAADRIAALTAELEHCERVMQIQQGVIYQLSCEIHGQAATDRAMRDARQRGRN